MSNSTLNIDNETADIDDLIDQADIDVEELRSEIELDINSELDNVDNALSDIEEFEEFDEIDDDAALGVAGAAGAAGGKSRERMWLILTIVFFILALLTGLALGPMISSQEGRVGNLDQIITGVSLTNTSARQSLTAGGRFEPLLKNIADSESDVNRLIGGSSPLAGVSNFLFDNKTLNDQIVGEWSKYQTATQKFITNQNELTEIKSRIARLSNSLSNVVAETVGFVEAVAKEGTNKNSGKDKDRYLFLTSEAANLNGIVSRLNASVRGYYLPSSDLPALVDSQTNLSARLQGTLSRIVSNSAAVVGTVATPLSEKYKVLANRFAEIGAGTPTLTESRIALDEMRDSGAALTQRLSNAKSQTSVSPLMKSLATILPLLLAMLGAFCLFRYSRAQATGMVAHDAGLESALAEQQESILKLLDEMSALADGDLTVEAEVTDQITGAIADSVNFAVMEMRELVTQINRASVEVANESELAVSSAQAVSQSNTSQAEEISQAASLMTKVSNDMREMSEQANNSSALATESLQVAEQGTQAVRDTISGMESMREQIQETSKRIKRLGESSQRIGDIVSLIDDIAEQTNILSLNAAIQASMAGEAGRGFAVVSDEVQSLAERSTEATKKIAELVTTIQNDTNDAVLSMEHATQQVVSGTKVADSAGNALSEIETVSQKLSNLVAGISKGSTEQAELVNTVSEQVTKVSESSTSTSQKAQDSANSIAKLLELAKDLETSVTRFKLPSN